MTPAPSQYRPDKFLKYEKREKLQPKRSSILNVIRWKDVDVAEI